MKKFLCIIIALSCFVLSGCSNYDDGYDDGYEKGYVAGYKEGLVVSSNEYDNGYADGVRDGRDELESEIDAIFRDIEKRYDMSPDEAMMVLFNYFWERSPSAMDDAVNALYEFFNDMEIIRYH